MSPPWILRRLPNVSPFFNSLINRLRITNYCLRSISSSLLIFTRFIQGNNIASTNLDMIRNLQHLHMNKKCYAYKTWSVTHHCNSKYRKSSQYLKASIIQSEWNSNLIGSASLYTHLPKLKSISQIIVKKKWWQLYIWPNFKAQQL